MIIKSTKGISTTIAAIAMVALLVVGLGVGYFLNSGATEVSGDQYPEDSEWRTGTLNLAGSTTVLPVAETAALDFMNTYSGTTVTVQGGGSGTGYASAIDGTVDVGMASRGPKQKEIDSGTDIWLHPIALDAVVVAVNPSVADNLELTLEQVAKIFAGEYTNWNQVDSSLPDAEIYVVVRESGSGTRGTFEEYTIDEFGLTIDSTKVHEQSSNPAVLNAVKNTENSIGYIGFGFLTSDVVPVSLAVEEGAEYVPATLENIQGGTYAISRLLYLVTSSPVESGSLAERFIDFILSSEGQAIVTSEGFLMLPASYNYP